MLNRADSTVGNALGRTDGTVGKILNQTDSKAFSPTDSTVGKVFSRINSRIDDIVAKVLAFPVAVFGQIPDTAQGALVLLRLIPRYRARCSFDQSWV